MIFRHSRQDVKIEQIKIAQTARGCGSSTVVVRLDRGLATGLSLVRNKMSHVEPGPMSLDDDGR
jgi:hypothetical protein